MKKQKPFARSHGVLMPIFSLDSPYGIGTLGSPCFRFVDFLCRAGATFWQMLPVGPTGYGDSPYQCFSAFAGNPYFLDPEWFVNKGWLPKENLNLFIYENNGRVNYDHLFKTRKTALKKAYLGFLNKATKADKTAYKNFKGQNNYWLDDYTSFMAIKSHFKGIGREGFGKFALKDTDSVNFASGYLADEKDFYAFLEFAFDRQFNELKDYAGQKGILLIGDIPLYVSNDSADIWAHPNLFLVSGSGHPTDVAGVPPDIFSKTGQLWGNPLYNWQEMEKDNFLWWQNRVKRQSQMFDIIRIDHFLGICNYYKIPATATTAVNGVWCKGPGEKLINAINIAAGNTTFIAEDLGPAGDDVFALLKRCGYPKMAVMQFAFDGGDNPNLIHNIPKNCVAYTGTHDNQTLCGFFENAPITARKFARKYLGVRRTADLPDAVIRHLFLSPANTVIVPLYDYLKLGNTARINTPAGMGGNWCWRVGANNLNMLADSILTLAKIYNREKF